jgi:hypothetical protein
MGVKTTHKDYERLAPKWKRCRDVIAGQDAMQTAAEAYLPKLKAEDDTEFKARVKRSDFFNGTWRTIDALGGMAFRKPPTAEVPASIESYLDDITLSGTSMEAFAKEALEEVLSVERIGILVDHPPAQLDEEGKIAPITQAVAEQMGIRPTLQLYATESIINWKFARLNNAWVLCMVVLKECAAIPKDEFTDTEEDRYRVLDLDGAGNYRQRVFRIDDKGQDELIEGPFYPLMNNRPLRYLPFAWIGTAGMNEKPDLPPMIDLIDKNVAHYQVNSDLRHGAHFTALPTLFLAGIDADSTGNAPKILIGGSEAITSPHPEARGEYIEFQGQGLGALEKMLDRMERQMAILGARMIADEAKQAETLGATQIKRAGENSVLAKIVQSVSAGLEWALGVFAEWAGQSGEITYQINRDFLPAMMDAQTMQALLAARIANELTPREYFDILQRGDVIDPSKQFDDHQREQTEEGPNPVRPTVKPADKAEAA